MQKRFGWACLFIASLASAEDSVWEETRLTAAPQLHAPGHSGTGAGRHAQALQAARNGRYDEALAGLRQLRRAYPDNRTYQLDLLTVAAWAGRYAEALEAGADLVPADLPLYALNALALAARHRQQTERALELYALLQARQPDNPDPAIGRIQTLVDAGRSNEALALAQPLFRQYPENDEVLAALARCYEHSRRWIEALGAAQAILARDPQLATARSLQFRALWRLGAPHAAARLPPPGLTAAEQQALEHDSLAFAQRWARIAAEGNPGPQRWQPLDRVIGEMAQLARNMDERQPSAGRSVRADTVAALTDRLRMAESLDSYNALAAETEPPAYVRLARAHALLYLEEPEAARVLFAELLEEQPELFEIESRLAYFYALLESGHHDEALAYIDALDKPPWMNTGIPASFRPDPDYPRLLLTQALARSYTERLADGQARLEALARRAPANNDIGSALAATYQMRGMNFAAEAHHDWMLGATPDYAWSRLGRFGSRLALADYPGAKADLQAAAAALPEEKAVSRATRAWETHNLRELHVEAEAGRSAGAAASPLGTRDRSLDAWLYSAPFDDHWRAYAHTHYATATFDDSRPVRTATGAGLEYRRRYWSGSAELYTLRGDSGGLLAQAAYTPDDHWRLDGRLSRRTLEAPLRAYAAGIQANSLGLGLTYRWHESRSARAGIEGLSFSDGNERRAWSAAWTERLASGPIYKADLRGDLYASSNSLAAVQAPYFNPSRDRSLSLSLIQEWTQFRRYERSLVHRLELGLGDYWQEGYGNGGIALVRYELAYAPDDRLELRLGISRSRRPYDGTPTTLDAISLMADWRF